MVLEMVSLYTNFDVELDCTLPHGDEVMFLEEQATMPAKTDTDLKTFEQQFSKQGMIFTHFEGLCGHCDYKQNCIWRTPETIIFSCEHYL